MITIIVIAMVATALLFDFLNGMHDAANSISTVVSTRLMSPRKALCWAAFFNFIACIVFGVSVADTIGKGIVDPHIMSLGIIFSAMVGAIIWNMITIRIGIPASSSHALVGGMMGAGLAKGGISVVMWKGIGIICAFIFLSPLFGMLFSIFTMVSMAWITNAMSPHKTSLSVKVGQLFSSALLSLAHGGNDAQKTMGVITIILFSQGYLTAFHVPLWVILACQTAMGVGTLCGGMKVMGTMGSGITKLSSTQAFCAESGCGIAMIVATILGIPVSTTHTMTGAIIGTGLTKRVKAVRWGKMFHIVIAWIVTIPCAALIGAGLYKSISLF